MIKESINDESAIKLELQKQDARILMKSDLSQSDMYQKELTDYFVPSGGTVDFIKTIEKIVSNSNIKSDIKTVTSESNDKTNVVGAELLKINMDVIGEWKNIQFFINLLEIYPLKIEIKSVSLNKFSDSMIKGKSVPQWAGNFEFTVLKLKDK